MTKEKRKYWYIAVGAVVGICIIAAIIFHIYYGNRWYPGSTFNQVKVSGMTYDESVKEVKKSIASYQLKVKARNKGSMTITGKEIDLAFTSEEQLKEMFEKQHEKSVLQAFFSGKSEKKVTAVTYSEAKLQQILKKSEILTGSDQYPIVKPQDATVVYSEKEKQGVLQKEVEGNQLIESELQNAIKQSVESLSDTADLTDQKKYPDVYKKPGLYQDDQELKDMQKTYNQLLLHWIQWNMGSDVTETLGPDTLKDCINVNTKKHTVKINQKSVEKWIEKFCLKYKTQGITRTFRTHSGRKIKIAGGDYGWRIDYDKVVKQVMKILKKAPYEKAIEAYQKDPTEKNSQALVTSLKPVYSHEGYRMDFQNKQNDWDTKNYSEVDLSAQEVFVYKNGKLVFSCTCITGKATPDRITRTGIYDIKEKKLTKTLTGADYSVETKYWTRIMWTGTGYHYSNRGDWGNWSPTYYKTAGSHGCVNLTLSDAASIYNLTKIGDPVFIHY